MKRKESTKRAIQEWYTIIGIALFAPIVYIWEKILYIGEEIAFQIMMILYIIFGGED